MSRKRANDLEMTDQRSPEGTADAGGTATPRWVKISAAIAVLVLVLIVVLVITGLGGEHGPGRHAALADQTAPAIFSRS